MTSLLPVFVSKAGASSSSTDFSATDVSTLTSAAWPLAPDSANANSATAAPVMNDRLSMVASQHDFLRIRGHKVGLDKDNSCAKRQICEAISIAWFCSSPFRKNKLLPFFRNYAYIPPIPPPLKRGVATVTDVGSGERWTRGVLLDEQGARGWRSRVVLASRCRGQVCG